MTQRYLALFDCAGIQEYIFAGNRLRENVGASELITQATDEYVELSVEAATGNSHLSLVQRQSRSFDEGPRLVN